MQKDMASIEMKSNLRVREGCGSGADVPIWMALEAEVMEGWR